MAQHGEKITTSLESSKVGPKGIVQTNANLAREKETKLKGAVRQGAISKIENKLKKEHPDWPDDTVKAVATRMFEKATSKPTGASSNEANEDERGPENEMGKGAPAGENFKDMATDGTSSPSTPSGLNT